MSNIIILAGSERKDGNTDMLIDAFRKGAAKKNEVEIISVRDYSIKPCIGCNSCFTRPGNECFQQDDMQMVYEKMKIRSAEDMKSKNRKIREKQKHKEYEYSKH